MAGGHNLDFLPMSINSPSLLVLVVTLQSQAMRRAVSWAIAPEPLTVGRFVGKLVPVVRLVSLIEILSAIGVLSLVGLFSLVGIGALVGCALFSKFCSLARIVSHVA